MEFGINPIDIAPSNSRSMFGIDLLDSRKRHPIHGFTNVCDCLTLGIQDGGQFMAIIQFRVEDELKKEASSVFEKLGLDLSSAMRMFLKRSVACNGIPFPMVLAKDAYVASEAIEVMKEAQEISRKNGNSEMTLEDINEEIAAARAEKRKRG